MTELIIKEEVYYDNKDEFVNTYTKLKLKWNKGKSGWFSKDELSYLLKLPTEKGFKRFDAVKCEGMEKFLREIGAKEKKEELEVVERKEEERKTLLLADDCYRRRLRKTLDSMPENWGVIWSEKGQTKK